MKREVRRGLIDKNIDKSNISVYNKSTKELPIDGLPLDGEMKQPPKERYGWLFFIIIIIDKLKISVYNKSEQGVVR